jgi:peptide/nickel transport system substrate-binding protein
MRRAPTTRGGAARRLSRRGLLGSAAAGLAGLGVAACTPSAASPAAPAAAPAATAGPAATRAPVAAQPKRGGTLRVMGGSDGRNVEPHVAGGASGAAGRGPLLCYSQLLAYKSAPDLKPPSYIPAPDLAESWTKADDVTYIFKLRAGVKFHNLPPVNGREFVAEDLLFTYDRIRALKSFAAYLAGIAKQEAIDRYTFKITLDKPNADLLDSLSNSNLVIVAKEAVEGVSGKLDDGPTIGTGPWIFESWKVNERFVAKRNPEYFLSGRPYLDAFEGLTNTDGSNFVNALRGGAADVVATGLSSQQGLDLEKAMPGGKVLYIPWDRTTTELMLNANLDLFKDIRVRQAISKAIDRKAIVDSVWLGKAEPTVGLSFPDPSFRLADAEMNQLLGRDVEGARRLLAQAGASGLSFEILAPTYQAGAFIAMTELIQANLKDIGVSTTITPVDSQTLTAAQVAGNFKALTGTFASAAPNGWLPTRYKTGGAQNWVKVSDPEMDRLIDQQFVMVNDPDGRKKVLQDIQRKIISDAIYVPLVLYYAPTAMRPEVKDCYPPANPSLQYKFWIDTWLDK